MAAPTVPIAEEEDDYMTMAIPEEPSKPISALRRMERQKREREQRGTPVSKKEREEAAALAREEALTTSLDPSNRGAKMMAKLGFKGGALGKDGAGRTEPIALAMKTDKGGIGMENEKKRKLREAFEERTTLEQRKKVSQDVYLERVKTEKEAARLEGQVIGAMKVAERLTEESREEISTRGLRNPEEINVRSVNVLWRGLLKRRLEQESERKSQRRLGQEGRFSSLTFSPPVAADGEAGASSRWLSAIDAPTAGAQRYTNEDRGARLPTLRDDEEDLDDKLALNATEEDLDPHAEIFDDDKDDAELDEFNALEPKVRLEKLVTYLREEHHYCYWCKYRYEDSSFEGCPGVSEEDHD